jgi:hypothetical protein
MKSMTSDFFLKNRKPNCKMKYLMMKKSLFFFAAIVLICSLPLNCVDHPARVEKSNQVTIAAYYFPNYHPNDRRNQELKGKGWSEWELVKAARPRFQAHQQPKIPLWGYTDESDPRVMAQKIDAAFSHGLDVFIFDWYWYDDGPYLERALDEGFLKAGNNNRLKFSLMWANHDWIDIHPYKKDSPKTVLFKGAVTKETFERLTVYVIKNYFKHPSYWKIDGKPYFSIYELNELMRSFGSLDATREALDQFRSQAMKEGFSDIHLNAVIWGSLIIPGENKTANPGEIIRKLGFNSVTSYVWIHHVDLPEQQTDYKYVKDAYFKYWTKADSLFKVPYYPNVTMGWDSSPRAGQDDPFGNFGYPFMNTIAGNSPERFQKALLDTKERVLTSPEPHIITINCWNEWTEGSYLEPDTRHKLAYLEAVRSVFGGPDIKSEAGDDQFRAISQEPVKKLPLDGEIFTIQGQTAFLILPKSVKSGRSIPWVWYAPALPGLPGEEEKWMFTRFLEKGIAIAGADVGESYGSPWGRDIYSAFYNEMVNNRSLAKKACLLARSRGGLMLYNWAAEHPQSVACIAGIYPVCNLNSYPGLEKASGAYNMTAAQLAAVSTEHNPIDRLASLARAEVPVFHIHGDSDQLVPLQDNSAELAKRYLAQDGKITLKVIKGGRHDMWTGWFQCQELVDFVIKYTQQED